MWRSGYRGRTFTNIEHYRSVRNSTHAANHHIDGLMWVLPVVNLTPCHTNMEHDSCLNYKLTLLTGFHSKEMRQQTHTHGFITHVTAGTRGLWDLWLGKYGDFKYGVFLPCFLYQCILPFLPIYWFLHHGLNQWWKLDSFTVAAILCSLFVLDSLFAAW